MKKKSGTPAAYRAIIRDMKSGKDRREIEKELKKLPDPYYISLGLMEIAAILGPRKQGERLAGESITFAVRVDRDWRRAELLGMLCRKIKAWPEGAEKEKIREKMLGPLRKIPQGDSMSDAIRGCSRFLCRSRTAELFTMSAENSIKDAKYVIKTAMEEGGNAKALADLIRGRKERGERAELLGYLHMQAGKHGLSENYLGEAVEDAVGIEGEARIEVFRYLVKQAGNLYELELLAKGIESLGVPEKARITAAIAGRADKIGSGDAAKKWFDDAESLLSAMEKGADRAAIMINLAEGVGRLGETERAERILKGLEADAKGNPGIAKKLCRAMKKLGLKTDICEPAEENGTEESTGQKSRISLVLFNTYEGGGSATHLRAIARAAPLCTAYGLDLVLADFPYTDMEKTAEKVIKETNIGRGGRFLRQMLKDGRIRLMNHDELIPAGICVATTSHPDEGKKIDMADAVRIVEKRQVLIIMGMGKHGLPPEFLKAVPHHLELTGKKIPLETCTAMGIIAERAARAVTELSAKES